MPPSIPEFFDSPDILDVVVALPWDDPSFFETPLFTIPMSLTRTAEPDFYYFGLAEIDFYCIFEGLLPKIVLSANIN